MDTAILTRNLEEAVVESEDGTRFFSIPVFFVIMRETLEVCLVLAVLFQYMRKTQTMKYTNHVLVGTAIGLFLDLIFGALIIVLFYEVKSAAFEGDDATTFECVLLFISCFIITVFSFGLAKMMKNMESKFKNKLDKFTNVLNKQVVTVGELEGQTGTVAIATRADVEGGKVVELDDKEIEQKAFGISAGRAFFLIAFTSTVREGMECVVFLGGVTGSYPPESIPIAAFMGIIVGGLLGFVLFASGLKLDLRSFAIGCMILLFFFAAGCLARAFHALVQLGADGGPNVWDARECCSVEDPFWNFMAMVFGWNDEPTVLEFMIYFGYWIILVIALYVTGTAEDLLTLPPIRTDEEVETASASS